MTKMKQTTLFALKSWKNAVNDDVIKCKKELEHQSVTEEVISKKLAFLKQRRLTKDSIISTGIDVTVKKLMTHSSMKVASQARILIECWGWKDEKESANHINGNKLHVENQKTQPDIEICHVQTKMEMCKTFPVSGNSKLPSENFMMPASNIINKSQSFLDTALTETTNKLCEQKSDGALCKAEKEILVTKRPFNEAERKALIRRLLNLGQEFTQILGEHEVQLYLNQPSACNIYVKKSKRVT